MNIKLIGISGASGSGKTTLAKKIIRTTSQSSLIELDSYYNDLSHMSFEDREAHNFDHPKAYDFSLLEKDLCSIKSGNTIDIPIYDYTTHTRTNKYNNIKPSQYIIIEGILLFHQKSIQDLIDYKIFIDTNIDICIKRRLNRDVEERGRNVEQINNQITSTTLPMFKKYVLPTKKYADIIINENIKISDLIKTINNL